LLYEIPKEIPHKRGGGGGGRFTLFLRRKPKKLNSLEGRILKELQVHICHHIIIRDNFSIVHSVFEENKTGLLKQEIVLSQSITIATLLYTEKSSGNIRPLGPVN
jgi:hypothetical protein